MKAILVFVVLVMPLLSFTQEKHYGLSVGVNFGKWSGDEALFAQSLADEMNSQAGFTGFTFNCAQRTGLSLGFFYDFPIKKSFSIQPEISYAQKGALFSGTGSYNYSSESYAVKTVMIYQSDYVDLVILAKYSFTENHIKPYLIAGPGISSLVSSRMKVNVSIEDESSSESSEISQEEKLDAHLNFGGGINFSDQIRIDLRYSYGLISIFKDDNGDGYKLRNRLISVNLLACF